MKKFLEQSWLYYKGQNSGFNIEEYLLLKFSVPLLGLIMYCIMASFGFRTNNLTYWVIGNSFLLCTSTCVFNIGTCFSSERYCGRLRSIIVSPYSKLVTILEKGFFPVVESFISVIIGFIIGGSIFSIDFSNINIALYLLIVLVGIFSACGLGMVLSVLGMITSEMHFLLNTTSIVLGLLTGANFPIIMLPSGIRFISYCLPLTRSMQAVNMMVQGSNMAEIWRLIIMEAILGMIYIVVSYMLLRCVEKTAVRRGTLEIF